MISGTLPLCSTLVLLFLIRVAWLGLALCRRSASMVLMSPAASATQLLRCDLHKYKRKPGSSQRAYNFPPKELCVFTNT